MSVWKILVIIAAFIVVGLVDRPEYYTLPGSPEASTDTLDMFNAFNVRSGALLPAAAPGGAPPLRQGSFFAEARP
ncbi:hypothetical protein F6V25_07880 [Oryzomonas japonica]|uniref:Uncharacterized protein n=1 Tax=Oryzomonas japonica TaxID=2603858 RepID=A0A7J4ZR19_9BACT|nr:hypothetical protein [Oryzomonas japonica]KAB0665632.1 hypothetical protein F6V25_07880 [Oryzomonas japonica]